MNTDAIIKQLEKALAKKDDKELRLRVEVLVDILKESRNITPLPPLPSLPSQSPITPLPTYYETDPPKVPQPTVTSKQPKINGPGAITSVNSEQINYKRPKGT